jgi:hypothetical protein
MCFALPCELSKGVNCALLAVSDQCLLRLWVLSNFLLICMMLAGWEGRARLWVAAAQVNQA